MWNSPSGKPASPLARKFHTVSVSWLLGTSLAVTMGLLFPHLCFLVFGFFFPSPSVLEMEARALRVLREWLDH